MELLLLLVYAGVVWLVFFKLKLLPWNFTSQVIVITLPIIGITMLILLANVYAPSSSDARVMNYVVQVVPRVSGRVIEVPVQPNSAVKKGDVLFRIDPESTQFEVDGLKAKVRELDAKVAGARAIEKQLLLERKTAQGRRASVAARLDLSRRRVRQHKVLASNGSGTQFDLQQVETEVRNLEGELAAANAAVGQVTQRLEARTVDGTLVELAQAEAGQQQALASLADAEWRLRETVTYAPADGTVVNLQLRAGSYAAALPISPVMSFVEDEQNVVAYFHQNELHQVQPGDEAEVTLQAFPNRVIKCHVKSVVWATGQGQLPTSGVLPETGGEAPPPGRYAVTLKVEKSEADEVLPAGARGHAAIYTQSFHPVHVLRKVILRVGTKLDWLILKLH
ncbi:HlyD family secretion protein [Myxococcus llanfairpwllgwyngyllgogerychwyrndrobwllllantysiliogogogochensis]|uniref:HlyD family secretion protein n=1 Tax=Myxococcus llanfairpwllgwyngyllgogerychwyrndrobwllllantysiliogogogochensis TaxID=2590453 RepID=A0A540X1S6_9BACT|nr:biotin/lipoyl-binding protein [Myxococcus llanfairpwllgwyngyllgogerychwyrndrobwllllantysiliogogogochensis]TQF15227.1 HlyD family secretion protein [Myxococcus llanfairpwllgwyngyllgogerychwyrndrobwllllantysiliogogogochensis]